MCPHPACQAVGVRGRSRRGAESSRLQGRGGNRVPLPRPGLRLPSQGGPACTQPAAPNASQTVADGWGRGLSWVKGRPLPLPKVLWDTSLAISKSLELGSTSVKRGPGVPSCPAAGPECGRGGWEGGALQAAPPATASLLPPITGGAVAPGRWNPGLRIRVPGSPDSRSPEQGMRDREGPQRAAAGGRVKPRTVPLLRRSHWPSWPWAQQGRVEGRTSRRGLGLLLRNPVVPSPECGRPATSSCRLPSSPCGVRGAGPALTRPPRGLLGTAVPEGGMPCRSWPGRPWRLGGGSSQSALCRRPLSSGAARPDVTEVCVRRP